MLLGSLTSTLTTLKPVLIRHAFLVVLSEHLLALQTETALGAESWCTPMGSFDSTVSKNGSQKVLEIAFEKVLRRCLAVGFRGRKCSEKGS